jgi:ABC-type glutathione transport system ATPase component
MYLGTLLRTEELTRTFRRRGAMRAAGESDEPRLDHAVDRVSFSIRRDECLALVGRSGCGKTTLARMLTLLLPRTSGKIYLDNREIGSFDADDLKRFRLRVRLIFQNQDAIFNPYLTVGATLDESLAHLTDLERRERQELMVELMEQVGLSPELLKRMPQKLSGGQKRRISIARALIGDPDLIIGDEPLASLDVFTQNRIVEQLWELRRRRRFSLLLITHDIKQVHKLADRIAVMHAGRIVEICRYDAELRHPYSINLFRASRLEQVDEATPSAEDAELTPDSCLYRPYCALYQKLGRPAVCRTVRPPLIQVRTGHFAACHLVER